MAPFSAHPLSSTLSNTTKDSNKKLTTEKQESPSLTSTDVTNQTIAVASLTDKMSSRNFQRGSGRAAGAQRREADMSAILSGPQKNELLLVVASITDSMQEQVCHVFDVRGPQVINNLSNIVSNIAASKKPALVDTDRIVPTETSRGKTDATGSAQSELKKEAITAFQRWQTSLTKRVSEISIAKPPLPPHSYQSQDNGPNGRRNKPPSRVIGKSLPAAEASKVSGGRKGKAADQSSVTGERASTSEGLPASFSSTVPIARLPPQKRRLLLHAMLLLVMSLEAYPAYSRIFMIRMAANLGIPSHIVSDEEFRIGLALSQAANGAITELTLKRSEEGRKDRRARPAAASALARLAAPIEAAKIGSLVGGFGIDAAATASVLGVMGTLSDGGLAICILFGLCGPRGSAPKTLDDFTKDIHDIAMLPLHRPHRLKDQEIATIAPEDLRLRICLAISGWMHDEEDSTGPWHILGERSEAYALSWEKETLTKIGASLSTVMGSMAWKNASKEFTNRKVLSNVNGFAWPSDLLKISKLVDNPWNVGMVRADKVGVALADAIINKLYGERGISLLGYSLGARAIYTCLMSLAERRVFGLVENVIMMGTPAPSSHFVWTSIRSVVSGRLINVFSENDFLLGFLHRTGCIQFGVAGLQRIQGVHGIENVDATKPVTNHLRYPSLIGKILRDVGWEDLSINEPSLDEAMKVTENDQRIDIEKNTEKPGTAAVTKTPEKKGKKRAGRRKPEPQLQAMSIVH